MSVKDLAKAPVDPRQKLRYGQMQLYKEKF